MKVSIDLLLAIIGKKEVELALLQEHLQAAQLRIEQLESKPSETHSDGAGVDA